jgi:spermidine synthase
MASYLQPGQSLTYYEIDPLVAQIAEDPKYFTYLGHCAPTADIVLGDARLKLHDAPDAHYGLIVLDAFSGDSIPIHLMTKEALALYLRKLAPGGLIAFHISNLYFDLTPTLGNLARDANLAAFVAVDTEIAPAERDGGKLPSIWVVMARDPADMNALLRKQGRAFRWQPLQGRANSRLWTDDYSNLLGVVKSFTSAE